MADHLGREPEYYRIRNIWYQILHRTTNEKTPAYKWYGARGITVCDRWHSFDNFLADMGPTYTMGMSIERIDNDGNYEPDNCRWATEKEQANNRRTSRYFTIDGITKTLAQWIEHYGAKSSTVRQRLYVCKWPIELALTGKPNE